MRKRLHSKKGFTLVELMVVVIIVGILAAVAVPLYRQNVQRALASEGKALCGSIRTAQRVYFAEHGVYGAWTDIDDNIDLTGNRYFTTAPTGIVGGGASFTATVTGTGDAAAISVTITDLGVITTVPAGL